MDEYQKILDKRKIPVEETGLAGFLSPQEKVIFSGSCDMNCRISTDKLLNWTSPIILTDRGVAFVYVKKSGKSEKVYFTYDKVAEAHRNYIMVKHHGYFVGIKSIPYSDEIKELILQRKNEYLDYIRQHKDDKQIYKKKFEKKQIKSIRKIETAWEKERRFDAKMQARWEAKRQKKMNK